MSPTNLTYAILHEKFRQQDQERRRAALVEAMKARTSTANPTDADGDGESNDGKTNEA